jgi:hypothetical protein
MLDSRKVAWPAYLVGFALIAIPFFDAAMSVYPWQFGEARWRFGAVGLLSNALMIPLSGVLVMYMTAVVLEHRMMERLIGILAFVASAVAFSGLVLFALDALQTRPSVRFEMRFSFHVASATAAVKTLLGGITFLGFGVGSLRRGPGGEDSHRLRKGGEAAPPLIATRRPGPPPIKAAPSEGPSDA